MDTQLETYNLSCSSMVNYNWDGVLHLENFSYMVSCVQFTPSHLQLSVDTLKVPNVIFSYIDKVVPAALTTATIPESITTLPSGVEEPFHFLLPGWNTPSPQIRVRNWKSSSYSSIKTYVVGTQKNYLNGTVL